MKISQLTNDLLTMTNDLTGNYDEVDCGCGFIYDQFKDFQVTDLNFCVNCGAEFILPESLTPTDHD